MKTRLPLLPLVFVFTLTSHCVFAEGASLDASLASLDIAEELLKPVAKQDIGKIADACIALLTDREWSKQESVNRENRQILYACLGKFVSQLSTDESIPEVWRSRITKAPEPSRADSAESFFAYAGATWNLAFRDISRLSKVGNSIEVDTYDRCQRARHAFLISVEKGLGAKDRLVAEKNADSIEAVVKSAKKLEAARLSEAMTRRSDPEKGKSGANPKAARSDPETMPKQLPIDRATKQQSESKNFVVQSDARANQTGEESGASGEGAIIVRSKEGTFDVRYRYDYPSAYLISSGRDNTLQGKSVVIFFDGARATHIACDSGNGKCQIKSFSKQ